MCLKENSLTVRHFLRKKGCVVFSVSSTPTLPLKYACDQCDNQFTQKSHLTTHIQSKHEGIKNVCDQCDYRATWKSHLITHIQSKHEGIRYACDQCNFQAKHQSHLTTHIQSKHEGIKYSCDQCDYQATLKKNHFEDYLPMAVSLCCDPGNRNPAERRPNIIMTSLPLCSVDLDAIIMKYIKTSVLICLFISFSSSS